MQVKLLLVTYYLNGRLHAVSIGKQSEWMWNFWTVFKNRIRTEFRFFCTSLPVTAHPYLSLHIPTCHCTSLAVTWQK